MKGSGQISLEYLLVMLVFLGLLGLTAPLINQARENAGIILSFKQAEAFAWQLKSEGEKLQLFSSGSKEELSFSPPTTWRLKIEDGLIEVSVERANGKEKTISLETGAKFGGLEEKVDAPASIQLENVQGEIIVSLNR